MPGVAAAVKGGSVLEALFSLITEMSFFLYGGTNDTDVGCPYRTTWCAALPGGALCDAAVKGGSVSEEVLSFIYMTSSLATEETIERSKKKRKKKSASGKAVWLGTPGRTVPVWAYTNEVALVAGSLNGMTTQSITPLARLLPKDTHSTAIYREVTKLSESGHGLEKPSQRQAQGREPHVVRNG